MQAVSEVVRHAPLDLPALVKSGEAAQRRIDAWPEWKREAARASTCACCTGRIGLPPRWGQR